MWLLRGAKADLNYLYSKEEMNWLDILSLNPVEGEFVSLEGLFNSYWNSIELNDACMKDFSASL
jgi:hypothetical protein